MVGPDQRGGCQHGRHQYVTGGTVKNEFSSEDWAGDSECFCYKRERSGSDCRKQVSIWLSP